MLKRKIEYTNFDGEKTDGIFYFHLSKPELIDMELEENGGLESTIHRMIEERDNRKIMEMFKKLIQASYGRKSEDGEHFEKSEEITKQFTQTAAYEQLFMELATDSKKAAEFLKGVIPADLIEEVEKMEKDEKLKLAPPAPPRL